MSNQQFDSKDYPSKDYRYFVFDPSNIVEIAYFKTEEERNEYAQELIDYHLDDTWSEEVANIVAGKVTHTTEQTDIVIRPVRENFKTQEDFEDALVEGNFSICDDEISYTCSYNLVEL